MNVAFILVPLFLAVGLWLLYYSRRRGRLVKRFADRRGLVHHERDRPGLEARLNHALAMESPYARSFFALRDLVQGDGVTMFRGQEVLDLSRYGKGENTHAGRIAVTFDSPPDADFHVLASKRGELTSMHAGRPPDAGDPALRRLQAALSQRPPPHSLSVTAKRGVGLAYLEPLVTGSESEADLDYLWWLGHELAAAGSR